MENLSKLVEGKILKDNTEDKLKVFVCGGANEVSEEFYRDAYKIGGLLAKLDLAYAQGGVADRKTMMGESFRGYIDAGGKSSYFITRKFDTGDVYKNMDVLGGAYVVDDIGGLIRAQYLWSDIVIVTPGGIGTLIELLSYVDQQNDYPNQNPYVIVYNKEINGKGFFDSFFRQLKEAEEIGFISPNVVKNSIVVTRTLDELTYTIEQHLEKCERKSRNM